MRKKYRILVFSIALMLVLVSATYVIMKRTFLFMPWEYEKSDALYLDWYEYSGEIEMYIGFIGDESYAVTITDKETIKFVLEEYMKAENVSHSRPEVEGLDIPSIYDDHYIIEISQVFSRDEDGSRSDWSNLFIDNVYTNTRVSQSYKGTYYYYYISDELYDFLMNYDFNGEQ